MGGFQPKERLKFKSHDDFNKLLWLRKDQIISKSRV